jgi:hypothetical protein
MTQWEYMILSEAGENIILADAKTVTNLKRTRTGLDQVMELVQYMDKLGADKWELVSTNTLASNEGGTRVYYFKRPIEPGGTYKSPERGT